MGHSNSVKNLTNYCNLEPEKSHFNLNHTGPTNLHEYDSFKGLGFHKDYFKIFLTIWNQFAKTAAFSKMFYAKLAMKLSFLAIIFQEAL